MKLEDLSRIYDQSALDAEKVRLERVQDSRKKKVKRTLRQRLMDTENTGEAVEVAIDALQDESPEVVLTAVVEVLGEVVGDLTTEVADSLKIITGLKKNVGKKRKADAATCMLLRSKIKDSESTEEAKDIAKTALDEVDPESVVEVVIDVLAEVIDDLEGEIIEE